MLYPGKKIEEVPIDENSRVDVGFVGATQAGKRTPRGHPGFNVELQVSVIVDDTVLFTTTVTTWLPSLGGEPYPHRPGLKYAAKSLAAVAAALWAAGNECRHNLRNSAFLAHCLKAVPF